MKNASFISAAYFFFTVSAFAAPNLRDSNLVLTEIASGLSFPTTMAFIGRNDILVLQKNDGRVRRVIAGVLQPGEVLDVAVDNASERGLLGIALHPNFPATPFIYLYYTESNSNPPTDTSGSPAANRVYHPSYSLVTSRIIVFSRTT